MDLRVFPGASGGEESSCNSGDIIMEDSPGKKNGCPVQYSFLENSLGREVWQATDHRFKRATQSLSNIHIHAHTHTHTHVPWI